MKKLFFYLFAIMAMVACSDDSSTEGGGNNGGNNGGGQTTQASLTVSPTNVDFSTDGGTGKVTITSSAAIILTMYAADTELSQVPHPCSRNGLSVTSSRESAMFPRLMFSKPPQNTEKSVLPSTASYRTGRHGPAISGDTNASIPNVIPIPPE